MFICQVAYYYWKRWESCKCFKSHVVIRRGGALVSKQQRVNLQLLFPFILVNPGATCNFSCLTSSFCLIKVSLSLGSTCYYEVFRNQEVKNSCLRINIKTSGDPHVFFDVAESNTMSTILKANKDCIYYANSYTNYMCHATSPHWRHFDFLK